MTFYITIIEPIYHYTSAKSRVSHCTTTPAQFLASSRSPGRTLGNAIWSNLSECQRSSSAMTLFLRLPPPLVRKRRGCKMNAFTPS